MFFTFIFLQMSAMLIVGLLCRHVMFRLGQPVVVGELIGGILLGPTVLGALTPEWFHWLFTPAPETSVGMESILTLGMVFFLFTAGLEVDLQHLRDQGMSILLTSVFGIILPFALGFGLVLLWPDLWRMENDRSLFIFALFIGIALSISALPVIAKILMDLGLIQNRLGVIVMASATINDLIGWALFAVLLSYFSLTGDEPKEIETTLGLMIVFSVLILSAGRWWGRRFLSWIRTHLSAPGSFIGVTTVLLLTAAAIAEAIGVHAIFGAFLMGVALSRASTDGNHEYTFLHELAVNFFAPLYFVSLGLKANFAESFDLSLVLVVLMISCIGKIIGAGVGARLGGLSMREALMVGFGMNARGAMEMILASVAMEYGIITERIFVALIIMALVTSMISGPMMRKLMDKPIALKGV